MKMKSIWIQLHIGPAIIECQSDPTALTLDSDPQALNPTRMLKDSSFHFGESSWIQIQTRMEVLGEKIGSYWVYSLYVQPVMQKHTR